MRTSALAKPVRASFCILFSIACFSLISAMPAGAQQKELDDSYSMPAPPKTFTQEEIDEKVEAEKDACRVRLEERDKDSVALREQQGVLQRAVADSRRRVEVCSKTPNLSDRVVCYDEIARDYGFKTLRDIQSQEEKMGEFGFWHVSKRVNDMGDEVLYLKIESVEPVISRSGVKRNPTFTIRCVGKKTDVYIDWKAPMGGYKASIKNTHIMYKVDGERLLNQQWQISQDNHAAFAPDPIGFVKQMTDHTKLVLIVTPYTDRSATLIFPLKGLAPALDILVTRCYNSDGSNPVGQQMLQQMK